MKKRRIPSVEEIKNFKGSYKEFREFTTIQPTPTEIAYKEYLDRFLTTLSNAVIGHPTRRWIYLVFRKTVDHDAINLLLWNLAKNDFTYKLSSSADLINIKITW